MALSTGYRVVLAFVDTPQESPLGVDRYELTGLTDMPHLGVVVLFLSGPIKVHRALVDTSTLEVILELEFLFREQGLIDIWVLKLSSHSRPLPSRIRIIPWNWPDSCDVDGVVDKAELVIGHLMLE